MVDKAVQNFARLPSILVNSLWWARNSSTFKDKDIPTEVTASITLNLAKEIVMELKSKNPKIPSMPTLDYEIPWGYFDEACQGHPPICGVGVVLFLNHKHSLQSKYTPDVETNNKVEFIALWTLLEATIKKDVKILQVMGDSKLVIDWARQKATMSNVRPAPLLRDIKLAYQSFEWLSFGHILWELNGKDDELST